MAFTAQSTKLKGELSLALALASVVIASSAQWFWTNVFYQSFVAGDALLAVIVIASGIFYIALLLQLKVKTIAIVTVRLILLALVTKLILQIMSSYINWDEIDLILKGLLLIGAILLLAATALKLPDVLWANLIRAITAASFIFMISFPLIGWATRIETKPIFNLGFLKDKTPAKNVVFLLLDEMSPELAAPVGEAVNKHLKYVQNSTIESVGKSTANVIPAMLSGQYFEEVMPCGKTTLCTQKIALDFSRLHAANTFTDVVGFHLPYCAIKGLRSCTQNMPSQHKLIWVMYDLVCNNFISISKCRFLLQENFSPAKQSKNASSPQLVSGTNEYLMQSVLSAPFWDKGGLLYAHLFLPHPRGVITQRTLAEEYRENMQQAADVVTQIIAKLRGRFGEDFIIVITSDHPLRVDWWCDNPVYERSECANGFAENTKQVPFIVGSPQKFARINVVSNLGLLADANDSVRSR